MSQGRVRGTHAADDERTTTSEKVAARFGSNGDRIVYLLGEYKLPITLAVLAGVGLLFSGRWGFPTLPEPVVLALQGFAIGAVPAAVAGRLVIKKYFADTRKLVLVLDPRDGTFSDVWRVPPRLWDHREDGRFPPLSVERGPIDHAVTRLAYIEDADQLIVEGCNPEIANPVDLIATEGKLDFVYEQGQVAMADLSRFKGTWKTLATEHEGRLFESLAEAYEHGVAWDPDAATETFNSELWKDESKDEQTDRTRTDRSPTLEDLADASERRKDALIGDGGEADE